MLNGDDALDTQASVRRANLRRALQLVFRNPGSETRAGIARATGLTAATASSLVAELIDLQLIVDGEQAASTGGKRATTLSIAAEHHVILVLVIRPTDARIALVALDGTEVETRRVAFSDESRDRMLDDAVSDVAAEYSGRLLVAGVQLPGTTDGRRVFESVQLGWTDVPLAERFEAVLGIPVLLVNDVDAEAIAEAAREDESSGYRLFIHIGTGIGAAVTLDGELAPGPRDRAGEIGHVQVEFGEEARTCRCGRQGCLESASSMTAMLGDDFDDAMDDEAIAALAAAADDERLAEGARALARTIKLIAAVLDAAEVVIGGPARALGDRFLPLVQAEVDYTATGTTNVPVRYADSDASISTGVAQVALSSALGVRWSPAQLRAASAVRD
ncbi:putative NBD/HSP70 family sugar kinase [Microbacterium foliorum]|jgi:predicted NBD/HSP70 family sugar kinase|uniref:NBD/HSP70 family sugar kinase n=1 Tax=Microbacterium foliorum TaxID=104336 RepID=A0ABU1HU15_9MICO|nr:ROK family protein [Microbacterium foliorum]MDR6143545.1 putative NBD/HSP70 family sugar kinase [Microbacterium foliorum]